MDIIINKKTYPSLEKCMHSSESERGPEVPKAAKALIYYKYSLEKMMLRMNKQITCLMLNIISIIRSKNSKKVHIFE